MLKDRFVTLYKKHFIKFEGSKLVFEMGDEIEDDELRVSQVLSRFEEISNEVFKINELWVLLIIWDKNRGTKKELEKCGFNLTDSSDFYYGSLEDGLFENSLFDQEALLESEILYIKYNNYKFKKIFPIIKAIAGYELGFEKSANISADFINMTSSSTTLLNLYDDRGMEMLSNDIKILNKINKKFVKYIK